MTQKKAIPEQVDYFLEMMAFQKSEEVDTLSEHIVRSRLKSVIIQAKMVAAGVDVYDVTGEDAAKADADFKAGRYYTLEKWEEGKWVFVKNPDWQDDDD